MYVKATGNTIQQFPYNIGLLKRENPQISFPEVIPNSTLEQFNVYPVTRDTEPTFDPDTERLEAQNNPVLTNGQWKIGWNVVPLDADSKFVKKRNSAIPNNYDSLDIEVLNLLRDEIQHFDNGSQVNTPGCALVATTLGVSEDNIRNAVRTKGNQYRQSVISAWAERRAAKGGA